MPQVGEEPEPHPRACDQESGQAEEPGYSELTEGVRPRRRLTEAAQWPGMPHHDAASQHQAYDVQRVAALQ